MQGNSVAGALTNCPSVQAYRYLTGLQTRDSTWKQIEFVLQAA